MVERAVLERQLPRKWYAGSNPVLSELMNKEQGDEVNLLGETCRNGM